MTYINEYSNYLNQKLAHNIPLIPFQTFCLLLDEGLTWDEILDIQVNDNGMIHVGGNIYRNIVTLEQVELVSSTATRSIAKGQQLEQDMQQMVLTPEFQANVEVGRQVIEEAKQAFRNQIKYGCWW